MVGAMHPLCVVANKLPVRPVRAGSGWRLERGEGGLVAALTPILQHKGGTWFGAGNAPPEGWRAIGRRIGFRVQQVEIDPNTLHDFYAGFSNATLWPLFHDFLGRSEFEPTWWHAYQRVNAAFAAAVDEDPLRDDVWVHDYHFLLLPAMLRRTRPWRRIRFFLHTPFPAYEIFRHIPWRLELLEGMMAADEVGFHTDLYRDQFLDCIARLFGSHYVQNDTIVRPQDGDPCRVRVLPISIDTAVLAETAARPEVLARVAELTATGTALVLGVDRLDYTKGLPERFLGIERYFEKYPQETGKVTFVQIAVPSRGEVGEYDRHRKAIEGLVGRINGRFGTADWSPIRYLHRHLPKTELLALYRAADVALVTPLCDGMNLVAKEYVAVKRGAAGVLVLSEFAGAAEELRQALLVNPHDTEAIADMLARALTMPEAERVRRMQAMYAYLLHNDIHAWGRAALQPITKHPTETARSAKRRPIHLPP